MYWPIIYKKISETIDKVIKEPQYAYIHLKELLDNISDIKSDNDGYLITTNFLYDINRLYVEAYIRELHYVFIPGFVKKVNSFTIKHYEKLDTFINNIDWDSDNIPENWIDLSNQAGFKISI